MLLLTAGSVTAGMLQPRALPGIPAADRNVTYAYLDKGSRPSVSIEFSPVDGAVDYPVLCTLHENDEGKEWGNVATLPNVLIRNVRYGEELDCYLGARNSEGTSVSEGYWIIPVLVDLPVPTKVTLKNDISSGGAFRVAWTEREAIPRWVPRLTYVTLLPMNSTKQLAKTLVRNRLARATNLQIPSGLASGKYRVCVTIENDVQGSGAIPKKSCAVRTISPSYSGGGSAGGSSSGGSTGGSSGDTGQTASIGPVRI